MSNRDFWDVSRVSYRVQRELDRYLETGKDWEIFLFTVSTDKFSYWEPEEFKAYIVSKGWHVNIPNVWERLQKDLLYLQRFTEFKAATEGRE